MSEQNTQRAEPVAWYMHLWNEADEDVKSEIRWGHPSAADIERAEHNGHDIEHLYAGSAPTAPAMTEQNKQSETPAPEQHAPGCNLTKDIRNWANWMVSCACGNVSDEARLLIDAADAIEGRYRSSALDDVIAERRRQFEVEGWTPGHDDAHSDGEMARAASCYARSAAIRGSDRKAMAFVLPLNWPWSREWWKPTDSRRDLVKAGALIIAEIERLDRTALATTEGKS
ncbi:hypothetical protein [Neorhizobium sp. DAR64872/K0K18]|uniref:hypothetical protein n=1 Tax=Neorhizobium sp. DAR64872/K0K18 TaxID=3421958 RepID=UPI003D2C8B9D